MIINRPRFVMNRGFCLFLTFEVTKSIVARFTTN